MSDRITVLHRRMENLKEMPNRTAQLIVQGAQDDAVSDYEHGDHWCLNRMRSMLAHEHMDLLYLAYLTHYGRKQAGLVRASVAAGKKLPGSVRQP